MEEYAGKLIIETDVDNDEFEQKMSDLEKKYANKKIDINITSKELADAESKLQEINNDLDARYQREKDIKDKLQEQEVLYENLKNQGKLGIQSISVEKNIEDYKAQLSENTDEAIKLLDSWEKQYIVVEKVSGKLQKQKNDLAEINSRMDDIAVQESNITFKNLNSNIKEISSGLTKVIKKVAKWALAIIGIRSAYNAIRKSISLVKGQNEEIANTFKVMEIAVANALTPLVQKIVDIIKNLMLYVDYIYFRLTSKHLFDFSKAFADANKNASGTAKSVNKMTASFDEMNIVQDNSGGGTSGGIATNPFEGWEDFKPPKWLEEITGKLRDFVDWLGKNWKKVVKWIALIGVALVGFKIGTWLANLGTAKDGVKALGTSFTGFFDGLGKGIEAIAILGGFALVIKEITGLIDTFAQSGLKLTDVIGLMATIIGSLVVLIAALTIASNALQSPLAMAGLLLLTASIAAILLVIKETLPTILDALGKFITEIGPTLNQILETIGTAIEKIIYALGTALPPIINSVGNLFEKIFNGISKVISTVGNVIVKILTTAKDLVTTVLSAILDFINRLGPAINNFVDNVIRAVTKLINFLISGIEYMINTLVISAIRGLVKKINEVIPGSEYDLNIPSYVSIPRFVPRLAKGTILNAPGKGVPVGGYQALAGEAGREAYLPLSDRQLLEELGSTIGRYVTINATIPVYAYNRLVDRQMVRIRAEDNFAGNR